MGHRQLTHSEHRKRERTRSQAAAAAGQTREGDGAVFETKKPQQQQGAVFETKTKKHSPRGGGILLELFPVPQ